MTAETVTISGITDNDDASAFFMEMVEPTVAVFLAQPADRRLGCLACLCLASMADHYFHARRSSRGDSKNENAFRAMISSASMAAVRKLGIMRQKGSVPAVTSLSSYGLTEPLSRVLFLLHTVMLRMP